MPIDFEDSEWTENVYWWFDRDGNEHEGMWQDYQRAEVTGVIIHLSDEGMEAHGRSADDEGFAEYHGLRFSDEYTLDDFFDEVDAPDHYETT